MKNVLLVTMLFLPFLSFAQLADSLLRVVPVEGTCNFRDAGGYKTKDNKEVVMGRIYRAADISRLTDNDMQLVADRKIKVVVDFRGTAESAAAPDRLLPGTDYTLCPAGSENVGNPNDAFSFLDDDNFLLSFYTTSGLPYFGDRYRPLFKKLVDLQDGEALLYHCTAGRDRTGMATALILYILNVPIETIVEDYLASNHYLKAMNQHNYTHLAEATGLSLEELEEKMMLRPEYIRGFFSTLENTYGSVENFMEQELNIGLKERELLKNKFTADI